MFVIVSGLPASGKTTVARALAQELGVPSISNDAIKEALFEAVGFGGLSVVEDAERGRRTPPSCGSRRTSTRPS